MRFRQAIVRPDPNRGRPDPWRIVKEASMPLKHIFGVDHVVITVRDLDAPRLNGKKLGFTVSPRGTHSPLLGTGNYTIMFQEDYLELLGVLTETEQNAPTRDFLSRARRHRAHGFHHG